MKLESKFDKYDRVKWIYSEPFAAPETLVGEVIEVVPLYKVRWDSGEVELVHGTRLEAEESE